MTSRNFGRFVDAVGATREIRLNSTLVSLDQVPHQIGTMYDAISRRSAGVGTVHTKVEWRSGVDIIQPVVAEPIFNFRWIEKPKDVEVGFMHKALCQYGMVVSVPGTGHPNVLVRLQHVNRRVDPPLLFPRDVVATRIHVITTGRHGLFGQSIPYGRHVPWLDVARHEAKNDI